MYDLFLQLVFVAVIAGFMIGESFQFSVRTVGRRIPYLDFNIDVVVKDVRLAFYVERFLG